MALKATFALQRHWWERPKGYTENAQIDHWDLRFDIPGNPGLTHFFLEKDPTQMNKLKAVLKPWAERKWMTEEGRYPPQTVVNPYKDLPANIKIVDRGDLTVFEDATEAKKVEFKGKSLKGIWSFTRQEGTDNWDMKKQ